MNGFSVQENPIVSSARFFSSSSSDPIKKRREISFSFLFCSSSRLEIQTVETYFWGLSLKVQNDRKKARKNDETNTKAPRIKENQQMIQLSDAK